MRKFTFIILSIFICEVVLAETTVFTGTISNDWNEPGNWDNGVPDFTKTAVINTGYTVDVSNSAGAIDVEGIQNSGTINITSNNVHINTGSIDNSGSMNCGNSDIVGWGTPPDGKLEVINTGIINNGSFDDVSTFTNEGFIDGSFSIHECDNFINQESGEFNCTDFTVAAGNFGNNGKINSENEVIIVTSYAFNNGTIYAIDGEVSIAVLRDYLRNNGKGNVTSVYNKVSLAGTKVNNAGEIIASNVNKSTNTDPSAGLVNIAVDSCWIHSDSAKIEAETIRFIFKLLDFIAIDSIMDIYANSKIEFWGTEGSMLSVIGQVAEDFIYVENGDIEIHVDSVRLFDYDINYYCYPDPFVGPADTTFIQAFIGSAYISDSANSSGSFKINTRNNSTGNRSFDYTISSQLGWVNTTTGTTQLLAPFQFDSLMIDYNIPFDGDTLTDTIMVTFSIPGEYNDTAYSYIHSYPGLTVGIETPYDENSNIELEVFPNPFSNQLSIKTKHHVNIKIYDLSGRLVEELNAEGNKEAYWFPESTTRNGIYLIKACSKEGYNLKLVILDR